MSPWGGWEGLQAAAAPPSSAGLPCARRAGVLAQLLFACTNARLFASLPPLHLCLSFSPDPTGVAWRGGGPGWGSECLSLPVSSPTLFLWPQRPSSAPLVCPPHRPVAHLHSSSKRLLSAFVCSAMAFCVMLHLVLQISVWPPSP